MSGSDSRARSAIRGCVHCGFCTATCPTYVLLGDERDSPRGRIELIDGMLSGGGSPSATTVRHLDRCLSCSSCKTTCPSGVDYSAIIDRGRERISELGARSWGDRFFRAVLGSVLSRRFSARAALRLGETVSGLGLRRALGFLAESVGGSSEGAFRRLSAGLRLSSATRHARLRDDGVATSATLEGERLGDGMIRHRASGTRRGLVFLAEGCVQPSSRPRLDAATIRCLTRRGWEVLRSSSSTCCGSLEAHIGRPRSAESTARRSVGVWSGILDSYDVEAIVMSSSGCEAGLVELPRRLESADSATRRAAERVAEKTDDVISFLSSREGFSGCRAPRRMRLGWQSPCSLRHVLRKHDVVSEVLSRIGFDVVEPREPHLCCGSAGVYNVLQPAIAERLGRRKRDALRDLSPDAVVSANVGCITQLDAAFADDADADAPRLPVAHAIEAIDWADGGANPFV